jgi:hypothetical protein
VKRLPALLVLALFTGTSVAVAQIAPAAGGTASTPSADSSTASFPATAPAPPPPPPATNMSAPSAAATAPAGAPPALAPSSADLEWHVPADGERFVPPRPAERTRSAHFVPSLRLRAMYMLEEEEFEVEASVRAGTEAVAGTVGVVTIGGDPVPLVGVEGFGFFGIDAFDKGGLSGQVLLPDVSVNLAFDRSLVLRAGSGLSGFRISRCMGPLSLVGQLRLPIIDVWMVPDDDFEDPLISVGAMLEIGLAL